MSENDAQDFIEVKYSNDIHGRLWLLTLFQHATYSVDSDNNVIVGLPPPREGWVTARSYCLEESLAERALQVGLMPSAIVELSEPFSVPERANEGGRSRCTSRIVSEAGISRCPYRVHGLFSHRRLMIPPQKYKQLKGLLHSLLPRRREGTCLSPKLEDLLDDADEDNPLTLRALRAFSIEQSRHDQTWYARAPVGALEAGDYGYIPGDSTDFSNFVRLGNIQGGEDRKEIMEAVGKVHGTMLVRSSGSSGFPQRQPASPFLIPDEMECWPVALPPRGNATVFVHHELGLASANAAWKLLVARGASLASTHGIQPQDLILGECRETLSART